jgi:transposase
VATSKRRPSAKLEEEQELRGFVVKAYPTQEQAKTLYQMQCECRLVWNYLVEQHNEHINRCIERAVADGVIPALPERPAKDAPLRDRKVWSRMWQRAQLPASMHIKKMEEFKWPALTMRADCYAPLRERAAAELGQERLLGCISMTRAVIARFTTSRVPKKGGTWRPPRFMRHSPPWIEHGMLQVRDGATFKAGTLGPRGWHDCHLNFSGVKLDCRAGRAIPDGRLVDGASLVRKADGWYASVRFARRKRELPQADKPLVGVCLGLIELATTSDGHSWTNPRGNEYTKLCAWMSEEAARMEGEGLHNEAFDMTAKRNRYMLRMARHSRDLVLASILPKLARHETVVLGTLKRQDVQGHRCALGEDDDGGATSACGMLRAMILERMGDRCMQVDLPGVDDEDPTGTARELAAKAAELMGS